MKKISIVSLAAPPTMSSHAQRVLSFVVELSKADYELTLYTREHDSKLKSVSSMWKILNKHCRVVEVQASRKRRFIDKLSSQKLSAGWFARVRQRIRNAYRKMSIPDTFSSFIEPLYEAIEKDIALNGRYDLIISSGAPFSSHIVAERISRQHKIKFVADYGDPWVYEPGRLRKFPRLFIEKKIESRVISAASKVFFTTPETVELYLEKFPFEESKYDVIYMGYDPVEYGVEHGRNETNSEAFKIVYTGRINSEYRNVETVKKLLEVIKKRGLESQFVVELYGNELEIARKNLREYIKDGIVSIFDAVEHSNYIKIISNANGLIIFGNNSRCQVPGKIAHYLATRRPLLYLMNSVEESSDPSLRLMRKSIDKGLFLDSESEINDFIDYIIAGKLTIEKSKGSLESLHWQQSVAPLLSFIKLSS